AGDGPARFGRPIPLTTRRCCMSTPGFGFAESDLRGRDDDVMVNVAPWLVSLFLHLGIIILALFLVWTTIRAQDEPVGNSIGSIIDPTPNLPALTPLPVDRKDLEESSAARAFSPAPPARNPMRPGDAVQPDLPPSFD